MKNTNRFEGFVTKLFILCLIAGVATVAAPLFSADAQTVTIPDANLRTALESALNKAVGADITEAELGGLRQLDARNSSITTLTGLEKATGLRSLNLKGNSVSDISPVVNLPRLRLLNVENNPLNYASLYTHIPAIERAMADRNNARVTYTARTPGTPAKISGDTQTGEPSATLANPFVVEVKDGANPAAVFAGVPVTFAVTAGGGTLSATSATTNASGRAETTLTLGSTEGANTVTASVTHAGTTLSVTFTATAESPNSAPTFTSGTTFSVAENSTAVGTVTASDADSSDSVTGYTLGGADSAEFSITDAGVLTFDAAPDYEFPGDATTNNEYTIVVTVTSGAGARALTATQTLTITVTDVDEAPGKPDAPAVTGADATPTELSVSWHAPTNTGPAINDYDVQYRAGTSGAFTDVDFTGIVTSTTLTGLTAGTSYQVQVRATNDEGTGSWSDAGTGTTATNVAPVFSSDTTAFSVNENSTAVTTATATDADASDSVTYTLSGADSAKFSISTSGELTFSTAPDFENPTDMQSTAPANAASNREYIVTITATSGTGARQLSVSKTLTITVTDVDEPPAKPDAPAVTGADATPTALSVSWTAPTNTGKPAITDYDVRYRKGTTGHFTNADYTGTTTSTTLTGLTAGTSYQVQVRATNDEGTGSWSDAGTGTTATNVAPVFSSDTTAFSVNENSTAVTTATATDADASDSVTYTLSGADSAKFSISTSGALTFSTAPDFENPTDVQSITPANVASNSVYIVTITATSGTGARQLAVSKALTVTVTDVNEPPAKPAAPTVTPHPTDLQLAITWTAPGNTGKPAITGYKIRYRKGTTGTFTEKTETVTGTSTTLTGLTANTSYQVQVRAINDEGNSPWSDAGTGTIADPFVHIPDANLRAGINNTLGATRARNADITHTELLSLTVLNWTNSRKDADRKIRDLTGVEKATNLRRLYLDHHSIANISALEDLTNLTILSLANNSIADLTPLEDLTNLTILWLDNNSITALTPLEDLTNLTKLALANNSITALTPLEDLTNLTDLGLDNNSIANLTPLEDLTNLTALRLNNNSVVDLTPLEDLTNLTNLLLANNSIADLTPLEDLTNLIGLRLNNNSIADLTPLEDLTNLRHLFLDNNSIADLTPLVSNTGLGSGSGKSVSLQHNPLSYSALYTDIQTLRTRGARVAFTSRIPTTLTKISGDVQTGDPGTSLANPFVVEVKDDANPAQVFAGVTVTFAVTRGGGTLSKTTDTTDANGRAQTTLTLHATSAGENTVNASVTHDRTTLNVSFKATADANDPPTLADRSQHTFSVAENTTTVGTIVATDADTQDEITGYKITGGADKSKFSITVTNRQAALSFKAAPDYERPGDAVSTDPVDEAGNNLYLVAIEITSGTGAREQKGTELLNVTVTDVNEPPEKPDAPTVTPVSAQPTTLNVRWTEPSNTGPGITDYDVQYREGTTGTFTEWVHTGTAKTTTITGLTAGTSYQVQVLAKNDEGTGAWSATGSGTTAANVAPTISGTGTFSVAENTTAVGTVVATDADPQDEITGYAITAGVDRSKFSITNAGVLTFRTAPDYETPGDVDSTTPANAAANNEYVIVVTATGGTGARALSSDPKTFTITVTDVNEPPDKPDAPTVAAATAASHNSLDVNWEELEDTSKPAVNDYDVQYREGTTGTFTEWPHTGTATTATITGLKPNTSYQVRVRATNVEGTGPWSDAGTGKTDYQPEDVNRDDEVNVADLIAIGNHIGGTRNAAHKPDVNKDDTVNSADSQLVIRVALNNSNALTDIDGNGDVDVEDLVAFAATPVDVNGDTKTDDDDIKLIARLALNEAAANRDAAPAPSQTHATLNAQNLQHLVHQALQSNRFDATYRRGVAALERILESLMIPEESALLNNYPNPFNPETWIPYQLASPAEVTLTLYDVTGRIVRTLNLGHQDAGMYRSKSRAAYWDGRNAQGEPVASGVYFYTLVAGEFTATGKMLIRK